MNLHETGKAAKVPKRILDKLSCVIKVKRRSWYSITDAQEMQKKKSREVAIIHKKAQGTNERKSEARM